MQEYYADNVLPYTWSELLGRGTSRAFDKSEEIIKYMKHKKYIDYAKSSSNVFSDTKKLLDQAKVHAKRIKKYQKASNPDGTRVYCFNPYTNMDEMLEEIESLQVIR